MITRREFCAASAAPALVASQKRQKNILFLIGDDLGRTTGAYGDPNAVTPNMDRMAREGVRFANAFGSTASCSPSRSVMLSGMHNHSTGQYGLGHADHNFSYKPAIMPLPRLLKNAGYATGYLGKLHVNPESVFEWDAAVQLNPRSVFEMAGKAKGFIQAAGGKPWYLHVGFTDPHRDFGNKDYPGVTRRKFDAAKIRVPSFLTDSPGVRAELAQYYESTHRLDQGIGFMFDVLKETGQLDNTVVVLLGDNGVPFPNAKTTVYDAGIHLPLIVWSPGQQKRGIVNQGMVSFVDLLPTFVDWAGARLPEYPVHGRSFLPILEQENPAGWDEVYCSHTFHEVTMYYPMRGIRTRRYKYIRNLYPELEYPHASDLWASAMWQDVLKNGKRGMVGRRTANQYLHRPAEELYDVTKDPDEVVNLAGSAAHRGDLENLRGKVEAWRHQTRDPWNIIDREREMGLK